MKSQLDLAREALEHNPTEANARRCERLLDRLKAAEHEPILTDEGREFMKRHGATA